MDGSDGGFCSHADERGRAPEHGTEELGSVYGEAWQGCAQRARFSFEAAAGRYTGGAGDAARTSDPLGGALYRQLLRG